MEDRQGMAPTPAQLERMRAVKMAQNHQEKVSKKNKNKGESQSVSLQSGSPPLGVKSDILNILNGKHWEFQKRVLDIIQIAVRPEKWPTIRSIVMEIQTEQVDTQRILIGRRITDHLIQEEELRESLRNESN